MSLKLNLNFRFFLWVIYIFYGSLVYEKKQRNITQKFKEI